MRSVDGEELELRADMRGVKKYFLSGRPLPNGTEVELRLEGGGWLRGVYEWSGIEARWPGLRVRLEVEQEPEGRHVYAVLALPPQSVIRWPREIQLKKVL